MVCHENVMLRVSRTGFPSTKSKEVEIGKEKTHE